MKPVWIVLVLVRCLVRVLMLMLVRLLYLKIQVNSKRFPLLIRRLLLVGTNNESDDDYRSRILLGERSR